MALYGVDGNLLYLLCSENDISACTLNIFSIIIIIIIIYFFRVFHISVS